MHLQLKKMTCKLLLIFLMLPCCATANIVYADYSLPSNCAAGNYSIANRDCSGSDGMAYKTICEAIANTDTGGGFVSAREGTYRQARCYTTRAFICPCVIRPYGNETIIIKPVEGAYAEANYPIFLFGDNANYVFANLELDGEMLTNCTGVCTATTVGHAYHYALGNHSAKTGEITVQNCNIHDWGHTGVKGSFTWDIKFNKFAHIGFTRWDHAVYAPGKGKFRYNYVHDISGGGLHAYDGGAGTVGLWEIIYNIFRNGGTDTTDDRDQSPILVQASHAKIYGNTIDTWRWGIVSYGPNHDFWMAKNNLIINTTHGDIKIENADSFGANSSFINNLFGSAIKCGGCTYINSLPLDDTPPNINTLPTFTSVSQTTWSDYKPSPGGSQVGTGVDLGSQYNRCIASSSTTWPPTLGTQGPNWNIGAFCN
jgi:hypothetical protein